MTESLIVYVKKGVFEMTELKVDEPEMKTYMVVCSVGDASGAVHMKWNRKFKGWSKHEGRMDPPKQYGAPSVLKAMGKHLWFAAGVFMIRCTDASIQTIKDINDELGVEYEVYCIQLLSNGQKDASRINSGKSNISKKGSI